MCVYVRAYVNALPPQWNTREAEETAVVWSPAEKARSPHSKKQVFSSRPEGKKTFPSGTYTTTMDTSVEETGMLYLLTYCTWQEIWVPATTLLPSPTSLLVRQSVVWCNPHYLHP